MLCRFRHWRYVTAGNGGKTPSGHLVPERSRTGKSMRLVLDRAAGGLGIVPAPSPVAERVEASRRCFPCQV